MNEMWASDEYQWHRPAKGGIPMCDTACEPKAFIQLNPFHAEEMMDEWTLRYLFEET